MLAWCPVRNSGIVWGENMKRIGNILLTVLILASLVIPLLPQHTAKAAPGIYDGYAHFEYLSFLNTTNSTFTNIPVIVNLTSSNFNFHSANSSGQDLRFSASDNTTPLPYFIVSWNVTTALATVIVNVNSVVASSNYTSKIIMHWGNSSATDNQSTLKAVTNGSDANVILNAPLYAIKTDFWNSPDNYGYLFTTTDNTTKPTWSSIGHTWSNGTEFWKSTTATFGTTNLTGTVIARFLTTDNASGAGKMILSSADEASANIYLYLGTSSTPPMQLGQQNADVADRGNGPAVVDAYGHVAAYGSNGTSYRMWLDGTSETISFSSGSDTGDWWADTVGRDNVIIGAWQRNAGVANWWKSGYISEIVAYDKILSQAEITQKTNEISWRYGNNIAYGIVDRIEPSTVSSSSVSMNKDGITTVSITSNVTNQGLTTIRTAYFQYGITPYTSNTTSQNVSAISDLYPIVSNNNTYLNIPTYESSNQTVHPDVLHFDTAWNGWEYWMSMTPYPGSDNTKENPSIVVSHDGNTWQVPVGLTNPITPAPTPPSHNDDADLFYDSASNQLWCYYLTSGNGTTNLNRKTSSNGINWSAEQNLISTTDYKIISPAFDKVGTTYYMWSKDFVIGSDNTSTVEMRTSADGINWSSAITTYIDIPGYNIWHLNVNYIPSKAEFWMIATSIETTNTINSPSQAGIWFATSSDGIYWKTYPYQSTPIIGRHTPLGTFWDSYPYRASFIYDAVNSKFRLWYSASNSSVWHIGYTENASFNRIPYPSFNATLPTNLIPGQTYHFRTAITDNSSTITYGSDSTFTLTLPSVTTGTPTNVGSTATLNGNISSMGVASSTYAYFQWWYDGGAINTTPLQTKNAVGAVTQSITFDPNKVLNTRIVATVGSVSVYGSTTTLPGIQGNSFFKTLIPILFGLVVAFVILSIVFSAGITIQGLALVVIGGTLAYYVVSAIVNLLF